MTGEHERLDPSSDEALRAALSASFYIIVPAVLASALFWTQVAAPRATTAVALLFGNALVLSMLAMRWHRHPPRSAHGATALVICLLFSTSMAQMLASPEPVLGVLHAIIAIGAAVFLIDPRWALGTLAFGVVTWAIPFALAPPSPQWTLVGYVVGTGLAAAWALRLARISSMRLIQHLREERLERQDESLRAEASLRASEARLREAQRIARMGSYSWDLTTGELAWSDELHRMFGWDPAEKRATIQDFYDTLHPDDRDMLVDDLARSLRDGTPVDHEYRALVEGEERHFHGRSETIFDEAGRAIRHAGTCTDITDHKRIERELRTTDGRMRAILAALDLDKVVSVARDGTIEAILGEHRREGYYGVDPDRVAGRNIRDFVPGEEGEQIHELVLGVYADGAPREVETELRFPNGAFHFDVSLRAVRYNGDDVSSVLCIVRDVTERKRTARVRQQNQKLESLGLLAGGIAHDFNNLLVGILSNAETALGEVPGTSAARAPLEDVLLAGQSAAELTGELLSYAGESKNGDKRLNLVTLVDGIAQLVQASVSGDVSIEIEHEAEGAWVHGDAAQLQQVAMNFLTNAAEAVAGRRGGVRVRTGVMHADAEFLDSCYLAEEVGPGEFAFLQVQDDGPGMGPATLGRIFDPFFTTKLEGRGLGLSSTLGAVRSHGGAIRVDSDPGEGTTFWALMPLAGPGEAEEQPVSAELPRGDGAVLVVDDEGVVRIGAARALRTLGYHVLQAGSGEEAVALLRRGDPVVRAALVDVTMPGMDGGQTADALHEIRPDLPILFMSGHGSEEVARRLRAARRLEHISKPFRTAALGEAIRRLLDA